MLLQCTEPGQGKLPRPREEEYERCICLSCSCDTIPQQRIRPCPSFRKSRHPPFDPASKKMLLSQRLPRLDRGLEARPTTTRKLSETCCGTATSTDRLLAFPKLQAGVCPICHRLPALPKQRWGFSLVQPELLSIRSEHQIFGLSWSPDSTMKMHVQTSAMYHGYIRQAWSW